MNLVENNIRSQHAGLMMDPPGGFQPSRLRAGNPLIRETEHKLSRRFVIHHIFLGCPRSESPSN